MKLLLFCCSTQVNSVSLLGSQTCLGRRSSSASALQIFVIALCVFSNVHVSSELALVLGVAIQAQPCWHTPWKGVDKMRLISSK